MGNAIKVVIVCGVVLVGGGIILIRSCVSAAKSVVQDATRPVRSGATVTLAEFTALQTGMNYEEAVKIIGGPGNEMSRVEIAGLAPTVVYAWDGEGTLGANMNATFQNGKLVSKAQFGLK